MKTTCLIGRQRCREGLLLCLDAQKSDHMCGFQGITVRRRQLSIQGRYSRVVLTVLELKQCIEQPFSHDDFGWCHYCPADVYSLDYMCGKIVVLSDG